MNNSFDESNDNGANVYLINNNEFVWQLTWTLAHPTLVSSMLFINVSPNPLDGMNCYDVQRNSNNLEFLDQEKKRKNSVKHDSNLTVPLSWSLLAYHELFGDISGINTVQAIVAKERIQDQVGKVCDGNQRKEKMKKNDEKNDADIKFESSNSHSISITSQANNLGYGEITPRTVMEVISEIKEMTLGENKHGDNVSFGSYSAKGTVLDLGSGTGRVLFAAALSHTFHRAIGIEIVENLHNDALKHLKKWNDRQLHKSNLNDSIDESWDDLHLGGNGFENGAKDNHDQNDEINISTNFEKFDTNGRNNVSKQNQNQNDFENGTQFVFLHEDLNNYSNSRKKSDTNSVINQKCKIGNRKIVDTSSAIASLNPQSLNIVIIHATLFDLDLMQSIQSICEDCPKGTFFVTVTKCLSNLTTSPSKVFGLIVEREMDMTWGIGTIYIQRRL